MNRIIASFAFALAFALPGIAMAEDAVLTRAGEVARVAVGTSETVAFFDTEGGRLTLTVLTTAEIYDGDTLRTQVTLRDGQRHSMILGGEPEAEGDRFDFVRLGDTVLISAKGGETARSAHFIRPEGATRIARLQAPETGDAL